MNRYQVLYYLEGFITFCVINNSEIQYLRLLIFKAFLTKTKSFQNLCTASLKCCYSMINAQPQIKICNIATNGRVAALVSSDSIYKERFYIWQTEPLQQANWSFHDSKISQLAVILQPKSSWFSCRAELCIVLVLEVGLSPAQSSHDQCQPLWWLLFSLWEFRWISSLLLLSQQQEDASRRDFIHSPN